MTRGRRKRTVPQYLNHRKWNLARVRWKGKDFYLGPYDSKESKRLYAHLLRWLSVTDDPPRNWKELSPDKFENDSTSVPTTAVTVVEVLAKYLRFAKGYYTQSNELENIKYTVKPQYAVKPLRELYSELPAAKFGPLALSKVRDAMVDGGLTRQGANKRVTKIRRVFRWAVSSELIPPSVSQSLDTLASLKAGRTTAPEADRTTCVADADIDAVLPLVTPQVKAMIQLQRLTGMRPGEVCSFRICDIDTAGDIWTYRPCEHKNAYRGQAREVYLGERAQAVLRPWLRVDDKCLFSPAESMAWFREQRSNARRTSQNCGNRRGTNRVSNPTKKPGDKYTTRAYRQAIRRACKKAGIDAWSPNQIRHTVGTEIRQQHGVEAAQVILGHKHIDATQHYAEVARNRGLAVVAEMG